MLDNFFSWLSSLFNDPSNRKLSNNSSYMDYASKSVATNTKVNPTNSSMMVTGHSGNIGNGNWAELLAKKYNMKLTNLAIGGKQTANDLQAVNSYFIMNPTAKSPAIVFIYSGLNDMWSGKTVAQVAKNQQAIIDLVRSKGAKRVYLVLGYDGMKVNRGVPKGGLSRGTTDAMIEDYKKRFETYQREVPSLIRNATIVPVERTIERVKLPNSNSYSKALVVDGLHLSAKAQSIFANHVDNNVFSINGVRP